MPEKPGISDAEWIVMQVLWEHAPLSASEVVELVSRCTAWKEPTIKTMLNRLVRKGALKFEEQGKKYLYRPAVTRRSCVRGEARSFAQRVFGGEVSSMIAHFVQDSHLTKKEIDELRRLLDEKGR